MWNLLWGDTTNQVSGQWNHEEHDDSEKAVEAAKTKMGMGLIAHSIHSPSGITWMSADELKGLDETAPASSPR